MVDKPKGRAEKLLERFFRWCRMQREELIDLFSPACELLKEKKTAHPMLAKITITASCLLVCGLIVVGFATPKTVHVVVDDSLGEVRTTKQQRCVWTLFWRNTKSTSFQIRI